MSFNGIKQQALAKKHLAQVWSKTKSDKLSVGSIMEEDIRENVAQCMQNIAELPGSEKLLQEQLGQSAMDSSNLGGSSVSQGAFTDAISDPDAHRFRPVEMALARRSQMNLFAYQAVGVQAMNSPVGLAYSMRFFYDGTDVESGFENVGNYSGFSGANGIVGANGVMKVSEEVITACDLLGKPVKECIDITTGKARVDITIGATPYTAGQVIAEVTGTSAWGSALSVGESEKLGIAVPSEGATPNGIGDSIPNAGSGSPISGRNPYATRQIRMRFDKKSIEAKDRMLGASFSLQSQYDIRTMQGVDLGRQMVKHLTYEIGAETDRELIWKMKTTAVFGDGGQNGVVPSINVGTAVASDFIADKKQLVADKIISMSNELHTATMKLAGNIAIVSPKISTVLQTTKNSSFSGNSNYVVNDGDNMVEVGILENKIKVFRDPWAYLDGGVDYALVCAKGEGIDHSGIIYHPYMLNLVSSAQSQEDFGTRIGVMSRYAITDNLLGSGRYYRYVEFVNLSAIGI